MERLTRQEKKEKTKSDVIDKALELFAVKGIGATSTADIARALGLSHGALFVHFETRDELTLAVVDRFGERLSREFASRIQESLDLRSLLRAHLEVLSEFEDFYVRLLVESQSLPPQIRSQVFAMNSFLSFQIFRAAAAPMKKGQVKKLDQKTLFTTWMSLLTYQLINRDLFSSRHPILKDKAAELIRVYFNLIQKKEIQ